MCIRDSLALRAAADAMDAAAEADVEAGGDGAPTEEQAAQYKEIGDEIDEFDAEDDGPEPGDVVASADLPGGSPEMCIRDSASTARTRPA